MKRAICLALVACAIAALAEEPQQPVVPAAEPAIPPATEQFTLPWLQDDPGERFKQRLKDSIELQKRLGRIPAQSMRMRGDTCYFIRTLRPVMPEGDAQRSGFIPLQARITGTVSGPVCSNGGALQRLIPVLERRVAEPVAPPVMPAGDKANR